MSWCYAAASVIGTSHLRDGNRLQDANKCFISESAEGSQFFVGIASDGAGSASFGGQGASIICRTLASRARSEIPLLSDLPTEVTVASWVEAARECVETAAKNRTLTPRDFAATLVMVIATRGAIVTAHVGDGAIVAREEESKSWVLLSGPQNGEYASTTFFVTDEPCASLRIKRHEAAFNAIAAFSDGIEHLVIDKISSTPSPAFFQPIASPFETSMVIGKDSSLSRSLADFLSSDRINDRTDDDKTLIVAVLK